MAKREDSEIIAVIAAVVSCISKSEGINLVVRGYRRVNQSSPVWNTSGRVERLRRDLCSYF